MITLSMSGPKICAPRLRLRLSIDFMKPSAKRVGMRSVASSCVAIETSPMRARVLASTSLPPPCASGAYMPASPRALVMPLAAPISAAWPSRLLAPPVRQAPTLKKNSEAGDVRSFARSIMNGVFVSAAL